MQPVLRRAIHKREQNEPFTATVWESLFSLIIVTILIAEVLLALTPPIARDAVIHHLALPKLWLQHGGFFETPWADFSYYPMNIDLLYLAALALGSDIIPNFIHLTFWAATGLLIYLYLRRPLGKIWALVGVVVFCTTPIVARLAAVAYVDLGLAFFTTASLLAFLQWRSGEYQERRWFIISALAMGLALGTKYNSLLAWFFLTLMVTFCAARDGLKPTAALKWGALYFFISLLVASPWYMKNAILTGNPFYPLFNPFFQHVMHPTALRDVVFDVVPAATGGWNGIFEMRRLLYGENLWQTILIPVRIFFEGQDDSDQYFDGVLSPLLLLMPAFAFLSRKSRRDAWPILMFSLFYLFMALFSEVVRVRYLLPIVPPLAILAAMGSKNAGEWACHKQGFVGVIGAGVLTVTLMFGFGGNALYFAKYFNSVDPLPYVFKRETKDIFLTRHLGSYPAMRYINEHLPVDSKIYLMFFGRRSYYLERDYSYDRSQGMEVINQLARLSVDEQRLRRCLLDLQCTHILFRTDLFLKYVTDNFDEETRSRLLQVMATQTSLIHEAGGYAILALSSQ